MAATDDKRIARVYAEALMASAAKANEVDAIGEELNELVSTIIGKFPPLREFFASPVIHRNAKSPVLAAALEGNASKLLRNFLLTLNANGRLGLVRQVRNAYEAMLDKSANRVRVNVRTAVPLGPDQQAALTKKLADTLKKEPVLNLIVDPDLLGGMIVRIGDRVIDTSVRTRIHTLRAQLMERGSSYVLQD